MKYAAFTVQMPEYEHEQVYQKLKAFGFDGVEWRVGSVIIQTPDPLPPKEMWYWQYNKATLDVNNPEQYIEKIKAWTAQYGIEPLSLASYLEPDRYDGLEKLCKAAKAMGCRMVRVFPFRYDGTKNYNDLFKRAKNSLGKLEEIASGYDVELNFEIHMDTIIPSASSAMRLLEGRNPRLLGVVYDCGNMVHEGYEQYKMGLELLGDFVHHIHIKDAAWTIDHTREKVFMPKWSPIGEGSVDFAALASAIHSVGYDRYVSFEDFSGKHSCDEKLINSLAYMKSLL
jgi:sugar phosphate isomerase/epimerase